MYQTDNYPNGMALEQVFHQHKDMVYSIALQTTHNTQDAEDITLRAFREAKRTLYERSRNRIAAQLLQIAVIESLRVVSNRDGGIPYGGEGDNYYGSEEDDFMLPTEYTERCELKGRMMQVIDALPVYQRLAMVMYIYNHLTIRATASAMRCSENAVRAHLCLAKATVKQNLEEIAYQNGEYYSAGMIPFNRVYSALIAEQAMTSQVASYIWDALQHTAERGAYGGAPITEPTEEREFSSGSKIAIGMSAAATALILVTVFAIIGFSPKIGSKSTSATEVETILVYATEEKSDSDSSSAQASSTATPPRQPRDPQPARQFEKRPESKSSSSGSRSSSKASSQSSSKPSSTTSSASSSKSAASSSSSASSEKDDTGDVNITVILNLISGSYDEQKENATDDFNTLDISSNGSVSLFNLSFLTGDNDSGYKYATISNLKKKSDGVYTFSAENGDSPLSGTKYTYYSSGTPKSELPFSSAYFEFSGGTLKTAVIIDSNNTVYK